jgi:hypothetical protein
MNRIFILALLALAACTAEPYSNSPEPQFHMPFTYAQWQVQKTAKACIVTTGYRGVSVAKARNGTIFVASTETLSPGEHLTINVNDHRYETSQTNFSDEDSAALVNDFLIADKAYLRWTKLGGGAHGFTFSDTILTLDGFAAQYRQCSLRPNRKSKASR